MIAQTLQNISVTHPSTTLKCFLLKPLLSVTARSGSPDCTWPVDSPDPDFDSALFARYLNNLSEPATVTTLSPLCDMLLTRTA